MPSFDIYSPQQMGAVVRRMTTFTESIPKDIVESGKGWYHEAHDVAAQAGKEFNIPTRSAAGMMASLSAGTEWETNKNAFHDLLRMPASHRGVIERSSVSPRRTEDAEALLAEHYPHLSTSTDRNILRATSIYKGADPEKVMPSSTAPKYNAFYRNIANPEGEDVTVDFRAFDLVSNEMYPSRDYNRGIDRGELLKKGRNPYQPNMPRYQRIADVYRRVAAQSGGVFTRPNQLQAVTWVAGKDIETSLPTKKGERRKTGMARKGQPYMDRSGRPINYGLLNWEERQ